MGRFVNSNGVVFEVDDSKDERYANLEVADKAPAKKAAAKKATPSKS